MTPLRQRLLDEMTLRGLSPKTQIAYVAAVKGLAEHYHSAPDKLCIEQLQAYLLHCLRVRQLSHSSCLQILHGLRFFYLKTLGWTSADLELPRPKRPQQLPEILNRTELERAAAPPYLLRCPQCQLGRLRPLPPMLPTPLSADADSS